MRVTNRSALALTGVLAVAMLGVIPASAEVDAAEGTRITSLIADSDATTVTVSGTATFVDTPVMTLQRNKVPNSIGHPNPYLMHASRPDPFGNTLRLTVHSAVDDDAYAPWQGSREMFNTKFALIDGEWDYFDPATHSYGLGARYFRVSVVTNDPVTSTVVTGFPSLDPVFYIQSCKYWSDGTVPGFNDDFGGIGVDVPTQEGCANVLNASTAISGTFTRTEDEIVVEWDISLDAIEADGDTYLARCQTHQWSHTVYNWYPAGPVTGGGDVCGMLVQNFNGSDPDEARNYIIPVPEVRMGIAPAGTPVSEVGLTVTGQVEPSGSFSGQLPAPAQPGEYLIVAEACYDGQRDWNFEPVRNNCDVSTSTVTH